MFGAILDIVSKFGPELLKVFGIGGVGTLIPLVVSIVEKLMPGPKRGKEKFHVVKLIAGAAIKISEKVTGKDIFVDDQAEEGLDEMINGAVKFYNSINSWPDIAVPKLK